jgi:hypothetical protein
MVKFLQGFPEYGDGEAGGLFRRIPIPEKHD